MPLRFLAGLLGICISGGSAVTEKIQENQCSRILKNEYDYRAAIGIPQFGFYPHMIKLITPEERPDKPESKNGIHYGYCYQDKWYPGYDFTVKTSYCVDPRKSVSEAFEYHREKARCYRRIYKT